MHKFHKFFQEKRQNSETSSFFQAENLVFFF
jgi:hypothetical protein